MRTLIISLAAVALLISGCSQSPAPSDQLAANQPPPGAEVGDLVVGDPVQHANLTVFPILSKQPKTADRFITLDEGLAAGTVKIVEVGVAEGEGAANEPDLLDEFLPNVEPVDEVEPPAEPEGSTCESEPEVSNDAEETPPVDNQGPADAPQNDEESAADDGDQQGGQGSGVGALDLPEAGDAQSNNDLPEDEPAAQQGGLLEEFEEYQANADESSGSEPHGQVNKLMVVNESDKPLYLMPGEVIYGGKQNRTIAQEVVIPPGGEPVAVDVYCVEQGRWSGRNLGDLSEDLAFAQAAFVVDQTSNAEELVREANSGRFVASVGNLGKDARLAVNQKGGQSKVWSEVAKKNASAGNDDEAGDFAATYLDKSVADRLKPYLDELEPVGETEQIVGVAVAVNGKMLSADVFESTPMFLKYWPKLLKSYALDAATAQSEEEIADAADVDACVAFLEELQEASAKVEDLPEGQKIVRRESSRVVSFSYYDAAAAEVEEMQFEADAFGGGVHVGGFAH